LDVFWYAFFTDVSHINVISTYCNVFLNYFSHLCVILYIIPLKYVVVELLLSLISAFLLYMLFMHFRPWSSFFCEYFSSWLWILCTAKREIFFYSYSVHHFYMPYLLFVVTSSLYFLNNYLELSYALFICGSWNLWRCRL